MTFVIIQIPCYNEEKHIAQAINAIRSNVKNEVFSYSIVVIDDGSKDKSIEIARKAGADHVLELKRNNGLAMAFKAGLAYSLELGADVIVNYDADMQYKAEDINLLIAPILKDDADIVIGARNIATSDNYKVSKKTLHRLGTQCINKLIEQKVSDPVSGFRAFSRQAAESINIVSTFSYTTESIIQADYKKLRIAEIETETNPTLRKSRLFKSVPHFIFQTGLTIIRTYAMYRPFKFFGSIGLALCLIGSLPILRFLWLFFLYDEAGKVQSLILGGVSFLTGVFFCALAILADIVSRNRKLIEEIILIQRKQKLDK